MRFLVFSFQIPKTSVGWGGGKTEGRRLGGGGGWGEEREGRRPLVAAAAGDEPFGPTTDRGYGDVVRCDLLQIGWLSLLISSGIRTNYCRFVKSFPCFGYL